MLEDRLCCIDTAGQRSPACVFLWSHLKEINLKLQFVLCSFSFRCSLMKIHGLMSCFSFQNVYFSEAVSEYFEY